ncbi:hypothetical protein D3C75_1079210 [compost metagenome]
MLHRDQLACVVILVTNALHLTCQSLLPHGYQTVEFGVIFTTQGLATGTGDDVHLPLFVVVE